MPGIKVRDMTPDDEYYVGSCTHENESAEIDACCKRRLAWLKDNYEYGVRAKAALLDGERVGFIYVIPIEACPWGPLGRDLMAVPCLVAHSKAKNRGIGRALLAAAEDEARAQGKKGLVVQAYDHDFWFMPAAYFLKQGYGIAERTGKPADLTADGGTKSEFMILWKTFDESAETPEFLKPDYEYGPISGKVVVDLFYNTTTARPC
jgi:GNAT superfamily N-acetyltransferase